VRVRSTLALGAAALAIAALVTAVLETGPAVREPGPDSTDSWLAFGGPAFMLRAFQNASGLVLVLPSIVFGLLVAVAVGAWWSPSMPWHVRAGVVASALFFLVAGLPYNVYWGVIVGPLLGLWLSHADDSTLLQASATGRTGSRRRARTARPRL
jgi:hypothetical protein